MTFPADKAIGDPVLVKTYTAGEALEANRFVKVDTTTDTLVVYADAGEAAIGVNRDAAASGDVVDIVMLGRWPVLAAGNITAGDPIAAAADGKAEVATTANQVIGRATQNANVATNVNVLLGVGGIF